MKRTTITLRFTEGKAQTVAGYVAEVAPHLPQTFVLHRAHHIVLGRQRAWDVSEQSTGCSLVRGDDFDTQAHVLATARRKLAQVTPEHMQRVLDAAFKAMRADGHDDMTQGVA